MTESQLASEPSWYLPFDFIPVVFVYTHVFNFYHVLESADKTAGSEKFQYSESEDQQAGSPHHDEEEGEHGNQEEDPTESSQSSFVDSLFEVMNKTRGQVHETWEKVCFNYKIGSIHVIAGALHGFAASSITFISHERKQVVIQFLIMFVDIMPLP